MHKEAYDFVAKTLKEVGGSAHKRVIEVGSYDVNGSIRPLFPEAEFYLGIDRRPGPAVDLVADVAEFAHSPASDSFVFETAFDLFVSTGSIEHSDDPAAFVRCAERVLKPGGWLILHGEGDRPHGQDGGALAPGETYRIITTDLLRSFLGAGWDRVDTWQARADVFCVARWGGPAPAPEPPADQDAVTETPAKPRRRRAASAG